VEWEKEVRVEARWPSEITNYDEKLSVARKVALLAKDGEAIGFGSGSTSFLAAREIAGRLRREGIRIWAIPTSQEIELACHGLGIPVTTLNDRRPDWSFDGADEVDARRRLIKGRGGAMFNEKLVMICAAKSFILADSAKLVDSLGQKFPVPVETAPKALVYVKKRLLDLGAAAIQLRPAKSKDGPVITESGNYILDAKFTDIGDSLEKEIKGIPGVIESGLFIGYPVELLLA
jgi:ribose 5-phosphate isomerase A